MNPNMEFAIKTAQAYNAVCKPLCQELKLPQTAFDILMFLANNPAGDRRKTGLLCTEKARSVIERGRAVQNAFFARLLTNTDEPTREAFFRTMEIIGKNLDDILKENA